MLLLTSAVSRAYMHSCHCAFARLRRLLTMRPASWLTLATPPPASRPLSPLQAPVTPFRLRPSGGALTLVVLSFDGFLYLIDGITGCAAAVDIGETSYAAPLIEDLSGSGRSDIVVATMNGNVMCFETDSVHHPLKAWPAQVPANNVVQSHDWYGIFAARSTREVEDRSGDKFDVSFTIVDNRPAGNKMAPYKVTASLMTPHGAAQRASGTFERPGTYSLSLPVPARRATGAVVLDMEDARRVRGQDEFAVSFHMGYHKLLKWLLVLPFLAMLGTFAVRRALVDHTTAALFLSHQTKIPFFVRAPVCQSCHLCASE